MPGLTTNSYEISTVTQAKTAKVHQLLTTASIIRYEFNNTAVMFLSTSGKVSPLYHRYDGASPPLARDVTATTPTTTTKEIFSSMSLKLSY